MLATPTATDSAPARKPAPWMKTARWHYPLLLFVVSAATFWQCLSLPFIQDDWGELQKSLTSDTLPRIEKAFIFRGLLMYRPAGRTYLHLLFKAFGETAWPCHALALCIHMLNAFMVLRIMKLLTKDKTIAVLCSLIYASAVAVHLDPLCWAVGIFDLGAAFFFFTSIALFLSGRSMLSGLFFFVGILFKSSILPLPLILAAIGLTRLKKWSMQNILSLARQVLPLLIVVVLALGANMAAEKSLFGRNDSDPYLFAPMGMHILENAYQYACWMLQSFLPFEEVGSVLSHYPLTNLIVFTVISAILATSCWSKLFGGLALWMLLSLLPALLMPNHFFRYYAIYALPAFICAVLLFFENLLTRLGVRQHRNAVLACAGAVCIFLSVGQGNHILAEGINSTGTLSDGTNCLVRKATYVQLVKSQLLLHLPKPANGATILLDGVELGSFNYSSGPRVWYRNDTLTIRELQDLRRDVRGFFLENQSSDMNSEKNLDAANLHVFYLSGQALLPIAPGELMKLAERQSEPLRSLPR